MLTSLSVHNFKSWELIEKMDLAPITGLFGANSSGKTSLLQLLLMLKQTVDSPDRKQVLNLGDERSPVSLGTFRDVVFGHNTTETVKFELAWKLPYQLDVADPQKKGGRLFSGSQLGFSASLGETRLGRIIVNEMEYRFSDHVFGMQRKSPKSERYEIRSSSDAMPAQSHMAETFQFKRSRGRPWDLPGPVKCYGFPPQVRTYYQNASFVSDFELAFEELCSRMYYLGPLREHPRREYVWAGAQPADMGYRGEKVVDALLASRERGERISRGKGRKRFTVEEYVAWWLKELDLIHSFFVEPIAEGSNLYRVWVQQSPRAPRVLLTEVGFGVSQILPVVTLCYYVPEGSIIFLEQPEIHLHPSVQAGLADVFLDAIRNRSVQIILESHSEHLLRRIQRRIAEEGFLAEDAALYFCHMEGGVSKLRRLQVDLFGNITNWPRDFFGDDFAEIAAITKATMERKKRAFQ